MLIHNRRIRNNIGSKAVQLRLDLRLLGLFNHSYKCVVSTRQVCLELINLDLRLLLFVVELYELVIKSFIYLTICLLSSLNIPASLFRLLHASLTRQLSRGAFSAIPATICIVSHACLTKTLK